MMNHPAHYYIKYLALTENLVSEDVVNNVLKQLGFLPVTDKELSYIQESLPDRPPDYRPWDPKHRATRRWLTDQGVYRLIHPDAYVEEMFSGILIKPLVREKVERLALSRMTPAKIAQTLAKVKVRLSEVCISYFIHYFWNSDMMSTADWTLYLEADKRVSIDGEYNAALMGGPGVAAYQLGVSFEIENSQILKEMKEEVYSQFCQTKALPLSTKKVEMTGNLVRSMINIDKREEETGASLDRVMKEFEKFALKKQKKQFKSLSQIAPNGSVSQTNQGDIINESKPKREPEV